MTVYKSLVIDILIITTLPFLTYFYAKHLIEKKVSRIKIMFFILGMILLFSFIFFLFYYIHLQDFLKVMNRQK
jgi:hypothetical protein